jgi:predicted porin
MKKSLLAVAAMSAFAGAAQAQSSVTVYGILDVGFIGTDYRGTALTAGTAGNGTTGAANQRANTTAFGQSAEATSRIGFRGIEDLGGGTNAFFTAEYSMNPGTTAGLAATNRQTFVGLGQKGIGKASIGTQYTPIHVLTGMTDAAGLNNLVGNAVYATTPQSGTGGANFGVAPYGGNSVTAQNLNGTTGAYTTRVSNALVFESERVFGAVGRILYAQMSQDQTTNGTADQTANAGGNVNNKAYGFGADYVWQKLQVAFAQQILDNNAPGSGAAGGVANSSIATGTAGTTSFGFNMKDTQQYAAATYDFGILKTFYQYSNRKAVSYEVGNNYTTRQAQQVGVSSMITPKIRAFATAGLGKSQYYSAAYQNPSSFRTSQLGMDYFLSKRTNLYALYGSVNQSSNGSNVEGSTIAASAGAGGVSVGATNYALGVKHTF